MNWRGLPKGIGAFLTTFAKAQPVVTVWVVIMFGMGLASILNPQKLSTPEVQKAQEEAQARRGVEVQKASQERTAERERTKALCEEKFLCLTYGKTRQECAVAGDFNNCMSVKVGVGLEHAKRYCTNDGDILYRPSQIPNKLECAVHKIDSLVK